MESEAKPWHMESDAIFRQVRSKILKNGEFTRLHEIESPWVRDDMMRKAGWTDRDMEASAKLKDLTDRLYDYAQSRGLFRDGERGFIERYLSHVRMRESMGIENPWRDVEHYLPKGFEFFADNMRDGGMTARHLDPRWLMQHYTRAMHWGLNVAEPMAEFHRVAEAAGVPKELAQIMKNWEAVTRTGYDLQSDMVVQGLKGTINAIGRPFGVKLSNQQAAHLINQGLTSMHWAFLGFRPQVLFRDAGQPLLAGIKGDMGTLMNVYKDYFAGSGREMLQRAVDGGWAEIGRAPVEAPSQFAGVDVMSEAGPTVESQASQFLTEKQQYVQRMMSKVDDIVRDATPAPLRNIAGSKLDPLYAYQKLGNLNRVISGEVGYRMASTAGERLNAYNMVSAGLGTDAQKTMIADLLKSDGTYKVFDKVRYLAESKLDTFQPAVGNKAWGKVSVGDYEGASKLAGREMANETQFQYGVRNLPQGARSVSGRMFMQFGTFTNQFASLMANGMSQGSMGSRVKFVASLAGITAGLKEASDLTGWNLNNWMWVRAFGWAGGPIVQGLAKDLPIFSAAVASVLPGGGTPGEEATTVQAVDNIPGALGTLGEMGLAMSPLGGVAAAGYAASQTVGAFGRTLNAPDPLHEIFGTALTGPSALGSSWRTHFNDVNEQVRDIHSQSLPMEQHLPPKPGGGAQY
jgi:hypothetical protein